MTADVRSWDAVGKIIREKLIFPVKQRLQRKLAPRMSLTISRIDCSKLLMVIIVTCRYMELFATFRFWNFVPSLSVNWDIFSRYQWVRFRAPVFQMKSINRFSKWKYCGFKKVRLMSIRLEGRINFEVRQLSFDFLRGRRLTQSNSPIVLVRDLCANVEARRFGECWNNFWIPKSKLRGKFFPRQFSFQMLGASANFKRTTAISVIDLNLSLDIKFDITYFRLHF